MSDKQKMLQAIRSRTLDAVELPDLNRTWITYADRCRQFADSLQFVGGRCVLVDRTEQINDVLREHPAFASAKKIVSHVAAVSGNVDLNTVEDPHLLEDVDFAIMPGHFGVAENGAVWITDEGVYQRAIYFIVQHLVLVIDADQLVDNMYQAYQRIDAGHRGFAAFISGPSKTADIEQSLVIGAHGPRSMTVILVEGKEMTKGQ